MTSRLTAARLAVQGAAYAVYLLVFHVPRELITDHRTPKEN